jgi:hypothetical protein
MALTRVTDLVDDIEAAQLNQYARLLEGELGSPVDLTALDDDTDYALQVGNQDATNGRAFRVFKNNLSDPWIDVTNDGVTVEKLRLRHISTPDAPGSNLLELYPKSDDRVYRRSGLAGAETKLADYSETVTSILTTTGDMAYASAANVVGRRAIGTAGFGLASLNSGLPDYADDRTFNPIRNAGLNSWSRGTSFTTAASNSETADKWIYSKSGVGVHTVARDTSVPTVGANSPLQNYSLLVDCTTVDASIGATDLYGVYNLILGYDYLPFAQKAFNLSFWVKATKTGTYCVAFVNSGTDRSYVAEYTVSVADTWEYKTVTVTASPSAGTWDYTTGNGLQVFWALAGGSTYQTTAGTWATGAFYCSANQVNAVDSTSNNFYISQPRISLGSNPLPFVGMPWHLAQLQAGLAGLVKIGETQLASAAASITFSSIPQNYRSLLLIAEVRGSTAATATLLKMVLNGSATAGDYNWEELIAAAGTPSSSESIGAAATMELGYMAAANSTANWFSTFHVWLDGYSRTDIFKAFRAQASGTTHAGTGSVVTGISSGMYESNTAISTVNIQPLAGNLDTLTRASLYGLAG